MPSIASLKTKQLILVTPLTRIQTTPNHKHGSVVRVKTQPSISVDLARNTQERGFPLSKRTGAIRWGYITTAHTAVTACPGHKDYIHVCASTNNQTSRACCRRSTKSKRRESRNLWALTVLPVYAVGLLVCVVVMVVVSCEGGRGCTAASRESRVGKNKIKFGSRACFPKKSGHAGKHHVTEKRVDR